MDNALGLNGIDFSPEINMVRYLQRIRQYPILSQEDEYEMAVKYQKTKDPNIAQILVTSHLRLVVKVVSKYKGYGLPTAEMISETSACCMPFRNLSRKKAFVFRHTPYGGLRLRFRNTY